MMDDEVVEALRGMSKHELEKLLKHIYTVRREKFPSVAERKKSRRPRSLTKVMGEDELIRLFRSGPHRLAARVFVLQFVFALRASEVSRLRASAGLLYVYADKTERLDVLPIPRNAEWLLEGVEGISLHPNTLGNWFRLARESAGLVEVWGESKRSGRRLFQYYNHCLRHSGIDFFRRVVGGDPFRLSSYSRHDLPSRFGALGHYAHRYDPDRFRCDMELCFGAFLEQLKPYLSEDSEGLLVPRLPAR